MSIRRTWGIGSEHNKNRNVERTIYNFLPCLDWQVWRSWQKNEAFEVRRARHWIEFRSNLRAPGAQRVLLKVFPSFGAIRQCVILILSFALKRFEYY